METNYASTQDDCMGMKVPDQLIIGGKWGFGEGHIKK